MFSLEELLIELNAMNGNAKALLEKYDNAGVKLDTKTNELLQLIATAGENGLTAIQTLINNSSVSGSNANGNYVKLIDGTLICYANADMNGVELESAYGVYRENRNFTFPHEFIDENISISGAGNSGYSHRASASVVNKSTYNASNVYHNEHNAQYDVYIIAIGRYK